MKSIRNKIMLALVAAILATGILVTFAVQSLLADILARSNRSMLSVSAGHGASIVSQRLLRLRDEFTDMAGDEIIGVFHRKSEYPLLHKHFANHYNTFSTIRLLSAKGVLDFDSAKDDPDPLPLSIHDPLAMQARADQGNAVSAVVHREKETGDIIRFALANVSYFGEFQGLVSADYPLSAIGLDLDLNLPQPAATLLVDGQGRALSLPPSQGRFQRPFGGTGDSGSAVPPWDQESLSDERVTFNGIPILFGSAPVPDTDWRVITLTPLSAISENLAALRKTVFAITAIAMAFVVLLSWPLASSLTRPIGRLTDSARTLAQGNFSKQAEVGSNDEIGVLAESFNHMRERLHGYWVELNDSRDELEKRVRERTEELQQEINVRKRSEELLKVASAKAESANKAKTIFLATMSHEIRTPLNGILGMLQILRGTNLDPNQEETIDIALKSCRRLNWLLNDLLDLSRIESGRMEIRNGHMDLKALMADVRHFFLSYLENDGVDLAVRCDRDIPPLLVGDEQRVRQILFNLVSNSAKFTPAGRIDVSAAVQGFSAPGRTKVLFTVADTGIGIPVDKLESLFQPFTQADSTYTRKFQGAGLGLNIVKNLVSMLEGTITVESDVGKGTTIRVSIPFGLSEQPMPESPSPRVSAESPTTAVGRVLVAEDDRVSRLAITRLLEREGIQVDEAEDGEQALAILKEKDFDLVLMDIQMPNLDGLAATRRVRDGEAGPDKARIPIVALTAHAMDGDKEAFLDAGLDGYLAKPAELTALVELLEDMAHRKRG